MHHFGEEEHVLQRALIIFINVVIFSRVLRGFFIGQFCATVEEILLAIKIDRFGLAYGHFGELVDSKEGGLWRFVGGGWAACMKPQLWPSAV
jgi:hypothetical protein